MKYLVILTSLLTLFSACSPKADPIIIQNKKSQYWYPGKKEMLDRYLTTYLSQVEDNIEVKPTAIIVPHAGYKYSAQTAAFAFKPIMKHSYKRVFIIGPSHYLPLRNQLVIPDANTYKTALAETPMDMKVIEELVKTKYFSKNSEPFYNEHSVDNEIPFVQHTTKSTPIIPIIMGRLNNNSIIEVGNILKRYADDDTLFVVSSDFTHLGSRFGYTPFKKNIQKNLKKIDMQAFTAIKTMDFQKFLRFKNKTRNTICGHMPIALLLATLPSTTKVNLLKYDTSGQKTKDFSTSVSYMSIFFSKKGVPMKPLIFNDDEKQSLLKLARTVLEKYILEKKQDTDPDIELSDNMKAIAGGFVTLNKSGNLRGCIGEILPNREVYKVVMDRVIDAAVNDYRFPPVTSEELKDIKIEISVLTPPVSVESYNEIELGKHGMILSKNGRSAVFLPQVAPDQGWDLDTTLTHLAMKAGLSPNDWKQDTNFEVFEAIVFHENK